MLGNVHCPDYEGVPEYGGPCWTCQGTNRCPMMKEIEKMNLVLYRGTGEWSALYKDGTLETVGDHYVVEERVFELLSAVDTYENKRKLALDRAAHLRAEADRLLGEAFALDAEWQ